MTYALKAVTAIALAVFALTSVPAQSQGFLDRAKSMLKDKTDDGSSGGAASALGSEQIADGLRDALRIGAERVVGTLGGVDGFNGAPDVHIPLPKSLSRAQSALSKIGQGALGDDLELRLNRAAEAAVPEASSLFADAISKLTITDARNILNGPDDAATQYFREKMSTPLADAMKPIVDEQLATAGAVAAYDNMIGRYKKLPFVPDAKANLTTYVLDRVVDGVFLYLGREEAAIRENPAKRTTELLKKVFGQ